VKEIEGIASIQDNFIITSFLGYVYLESGEEGAKKWRQLMKKWY